MVVILTLIQEGIHHKHENSNSLCRIVYLQFCIDMNLVGATMKLEETLKLITSGNQFNTNFKQNS